LFFKPHPNPLLWRRGDENRKREMKLPSPTREREFKGEV